MTRFARFAPLALLLLAACGGDLKDSLGLTHRAPDEYRVYSRPPLSVPPDFNLQAPGNGSAAGLNQAADQAHSALLGTAPQAPISATPASPFVNLSATATQPVTSSSLPSASDAKFLSDAGATQADPHVRSKIQDEADTALTTKDSSYLITPSTTTEPVIDPAKEANRIKQDKDQNKPVTTGETPVIVPKDKGILGDWF